MVIPVFFRAVLVLAGSAPVLASQLFVASYSGVISTLSLNENAGGSFGLDLVATSTACGGSPSWLTLDHERDVLYCSDRGLSAKNGTLTTLEIQNNGSLVALDQILTPLGAVSTVLYSKTALAVAYYSSSGVGSIDVQDLNAITPLQNFQYTLAAPGNDPQFETAPHPHEAITDPTGSFVLIPDLGADLVRLYHVNKRTKLLEPFAPLKVPVGSGPRHASWLVTKSETYFYLVSQLTNVLTAYAVTYNKDDTLSFSPIFSQSLLKTASSTDLQFYSAAAEIHTTPDQNFLIVSQRNDTFFNIPNPSSTSATTIPSDSLLTYSLDHSNGNFSLIDISPAGGSFPRQFSINKAGDLMAVGLQNDGRVVIVKRDVKTGKSLEIVAGMDIEGEVVCALWDE